MLGKPTLDIAKQMVSIGMKEIFRGLGGEGSKLIMLQRQNEILKGYLAEVIGPLDPKHPEETLNATIKRRDGG